MLCFDPFTQERIAYQKLLKDFNRMEAATENLQDEVQCLNIICDVDGNLISDQVNILRGGGGRASVVSMAEGDESAYGSVSGRSSLVSTLDRFPVLQNIDFKLKSNFFVKAGERPAAGQPDSASREWATRRRAHDEAPERLEGGSQGEGRAREKVGGGGGDKGSAGITQAARG